MSTIRLTVVVDNRAAEGLVAEHGFALHLETPEGNILLDTGQKDALMPNLAALAIDPGKVSRLVLSHGHYDHTGGVAELLSLNRDIELYLHAAVFQPRYSLDGTLPKIVKMPLKAMEAVMHHSDSRTHWLTKPVAISNCIGITGPIARKSEFEDTGGSFFLDPEGREVDIIKDDIAMWLHGPGGLVVCVGCCHSGLVNTLNHIVARTGENRIATVIGGLHLLHASSARLEKTVEALRRFEIGRIVACHCSGDDAVRFLQDNLDTEVTTGYAGLVLEL